MDIVSLRQALGPALLELLRLCVWLLLLTIIFLPIERRWGIHKQKFFRKAFGTDLVYYFLSSLAPRLFLVIPMTFLAAAVHRYEPAAFYTWASGLPGVVRFLLALIAGDFGVYWAHRWSHEIPFLWRFHKIHHSAEEMDWLVNSKAHPVDILLTRISGLVPMYVLGLAQPMGDRLDWTPMLVTIAGTMWGFFIHSNWNLRLGWFEHVLSTPGFHHWHHTNDGPEVLNKNYAAMVPMLDAVFGTLYLPARWPGKYGTDAPSPSGLGEQLLEPLLPK